MQKVQRRPVECDDICNLYTNNAVKTHTRRRKLGSDDLGLRAGFMASNQAGKPPKSHSETKRNSQW